MNWVDVYKKFADIVDAEPVGPNMSARIESKVVELYEQHKGEPAWDMAYSKWCNGGNK